MSAFEPEQISKPIYGQTIEELADQFLKEQRSPTPPTILDYINRHPRLEAEIHELFPTILQMENLRHGRRTKRSDGRVLSGPEKIERLGDYRIIDEIGRGGMGIIYRAHHEPLQREVALKVLPKNILGEARVEGFMREAKFAAKLHHTNIVPIYDVGEHNGISYYAMQLIQGKSLDAWVNDSETSMAPQELANVFREIASALQYAHQQEVLHRDIKPGNIMLDSDSTAWITDFGLAESASEKAKQNSSPRSNRFSGTLEYMPPERFSGTYDHRSEIWCLGVTMIDVASKRTTFSGSKDSIVADRIKTGTTNAIESLAGRMPKDLLAIMRKSTMVDPTDRYDSIEEMGKDLSRFLSKRPVSARQYRYTERLATWAKRRPALAFMSAVATLSLIAITAITSFGFYQISQALESESQQRARAERSKQIASNVMDEIFYRFNPNSAFGAQQVDEDFMQPLMSREAAMTLEELSKYYQQMANEDNVERKTDLKIALASGKVGEIYCRLGEYDRAFRAYQDSLNTMRTLPPAEFDRNQVLFARLLNESGVALRLAGKPERARHTFEKAVRYLERDLGNDETQIDLETAHSYYLNNRAIRPGKGPYSFPQVESSPLLEDWLIPENTSLQKRTAALTPAVEIIKRRLDVIPENDPIRQHFLLLLTKCYREMIADELENITDEQLELELQSVAILEQLLEDSPPSQKQNYTFELHETLAKGNYFGDVPVDMQADRFANLQRASDLIIELAATRPDVMQFQLAAIHTAFKNSLLIDKMLNAADSESQKKKLRQTSLQHLRTAVRLQRMVCRSYPEALGHKAWLARFLLSKAQLEIEHGNPGYAWQNSRQAKRALAEIPEPWSKRPVCKLMQQEISRFSKPDRRQLPFEATSTGSD